ncbi:AGAP003646-PA-like protein [Anopheles sinensis]|uniref:AGAP003646-PA-like protein n=1 Tax=Anopheles sinensis TaxID=74873 RepID=A0A084VTM5_ANOSI|nr:AGAP003646-PA-like protein [Anopheles sinensis]
MCTCLSIAKTQHLLCGLSAKGTGSQRIEAILSRQLQYKYDNPYYKLYRDVDRIIITEDTKISPNYKTLLRQPSPLPQKIRKLQQLFPPVHRMPFQKHTDIVAMFEALRRKELEIYQFYHDASTSTLHDNIDLLVDRTPLHLRQWPVPPIIGDKELRSIRAESESSAEVNSIVLSQGRFSDLQVDVSADSLSFVPETVPASTQQSTQQGISSQSSLLRSQVVSQTVHQDISSQSVSAAIDNPILSESYGYEVPALPAIEDFPHVSSTSSSGSEFLANRRTIVARRGGVVYHDSQEAGPSGIQMNQQQRRQNEPEAAEPAMKRRRASPLPMNPSPTDFHPRHAGTRTPRLHGG